MFRWTTRPAFLLVVPAVASLVAGTWGGLERLGWALPAGRADLVALHGPVMVLGFLGTVIGLERAVALGAPWAFTAPVGTVAGVVMLLAGARQGVAQLVILGAALVLLAVLVRLSFRHLTLSAALLVLSAGLYAVGDVLWLAGLSLSEVVPWWTAFLVLTIVAERLELAALGRLDRRGMLALVSLIGLLGVGLCLSHWEAVGGARIVGAAYLGVASWLAAFDLARRTIRLPGLPRFVAVALIAGYVWLGIAGALMLLHGLASGLQHDASSHAIFVGFVLSMIFAHAPIVFPALLGLALPFRRSFYLHLVLLHCGLAMRVAGDLVGDSGLARAGGLAGASAIALFLAMTAGSMLAARRRGGRRPPRRHHPSATAGGTERGAR